jgi:polygalacturonase
MKVFAAAVVFMWLASCCGAAFAEVVQSRVFNVRDRGARGDGKSLDTAAIQQSLDACGDAGGGTVLLPPGTYLSRPLVLRTKTTLLVEKGATLLATDDPADYKRTDKPNTYRAKIWRT